MNGIEIVARNPIFFKITTAFENTLEATEDTAIFGTHLIITNTYIALIRMRSKRFTFIVLQYEQYNTIY